MTKARDIASAIPAPSTVDATELGYLDGVTSAIQTQLDAKTAKSTLTTTGDIYYASAANTPARLAIGSTSNVLTVAGGIPSWAAPAGGGGMTSIASGSLSGAGTLNLTSISQDYNDLRLVIRDYGTVSATAVSVRVNADSTANIYLRNQTNVNTSSAFNNPGQDAQNFISENHNPASGNQKNAVVITCLDYTNTTACKLITWEAGFLNDSSVQASSRNLISYNSTNAITQVNFIVHSGNFTSGTYILYGVK